ncbi:MAG: hypothetical protein Q8S96_09105 [Hydrogenophaga sp.]|uniref:hypothetical protein n=1 Tax=Hydrogenophaga sp. TaxID=1904254 RepID=UPI0027207AEF|nr:hypothetical protein [Hydrogenophaga sp.]MDO9479452.1 hypothetical protein [Hydrogenophaga sp.]MDP3344602.1 hypothetical protein [Hydrogenophaga sp.]MDP3806588.1 hypothetical protein [Hydrogenophaga sp.]MDP3924455.1 hypothetical protein [Hydrogenophaga sp.]
MDIVIEETVGGHKILIGIECTSGKRKATVEWYREMRAKHADLPISKTVLVSASGFTQEVHKKAKTDDITLLIPIEAATFKWQALFTELKGGTVADVGFSIREVHFTFRSEPNKTQPIDLDVNTTVQGPGINCPIGQLVMDVAVNGGLTRKVMADLASILKKTDHFSFTFRTPKNTYVLAGTERLEVFEINATLTIHPRFRPVDWHPLEFNGQTVATGTIPADFLSPGAGGDAIFTVSRDDNDSVKVSLLGPSDTDIQLDVFPHALWSDVGN